MTHEHVKSATDKAKGAIEDSSKKQPEPEFDKPLGSSHNAYHIPQIQLIAINGFLEDEGLTRGAAIAFYTATSFAPVLLIVIAIAGLVYGQEAAQGAITTQLGDLMGRQTAELLQTAVASSKSRSSGFEYVQSGKSSFGLQQRDAILRDAGGLQ